MAGGIEIKNGVLVPQEPALDLVRLLSEGTYTSFPQALKEFLSNSFDADSKRVDIQIDEDGNGITIRDNGNGMTVEDFGSAFASLARSGAMKKGTKRGRTDGGRVKIGRFGIGALAMLSMCDRFSIRSTKVGSTQGFVARMDVKTLTAKFGRGENLSDSWKFLAEEWKNEKTSTHFTEVRLEGLAPEIRSLFERPGENKLTEPISSITQLSGIDQLRWQLGIICPVAYADGGPIRTADLNKTRDAVIIEKSRKLLRDHFSVYLNGEEIRRRISLPQYKTNTRNTREHDELVKRGVGYGLTCFRSEKKAPVRYEGYVMVQAQQLFPTELRGLLVRLRGVAVGGYKTFNLSGSSVSTMLPNMSGEIWIESGLEEALQFDRESFREDHPNFIYFKNSIEKTIEAESREFRKRSAKRNNPRKKRAGTTGSNGATTDTPPPDEPSPPPPDPPLTDVYIDPEIFKACPDFLRFLIPLINGCWDRQWFEASALLIRRLLETLIIHLYEKRGWSSEIKTPDGYYKLQKLVDKVCGDPRIGLGKHPKNGLQHLKAIGDVAAHDYRIRIKRSDLESKRLELRLACERIVFIADQP